MSKAASQSDPLPQELPQELPQKGFAELWLKSQTTLGGYVCAHVPDHSLAEDVMQEVAQQAATHFDQYDHAKPFSGWLIGIARQRIADVYRQQNRRPVLFSSDIVDSVAQAFQQLEPQEDDRVAGLLVCLDKLSPRHRRVLDLKYDKRQSTKQVAEQIGLSHGAIDTMIYRIREALRQCVNQYLDSQNSTNKIPNLRPRS